jgi:predicted N-acetyltransferase YhbS
MIDTSTTTASAARVTTPTRVELGDNLVLRSVQSQADADRFAAFNTQIVDAVQGLTCAKLLAHHPTMRWDDFFFVEDERTGEMVSCICLIPWHSRFGGIDLRVAMLEMVVTHPDYRHRGLVRRQIEHFHQIVAAQNFDLCIIEGIPYYYRQYGYAYATDHWASDGLALARVPDGASLLRLRAATMADVDLLDTFYTQAMSKPAGWTTRTLDYWRYLLEGAKYPLVMVENASDGAALGYVAAWRTSWGAYIAESGIPAAATALSLLQWCKTHAQGEVAIGWPTTNTLLEVARSLGSSLRPSDQWLLRVVDLPCLLLKMAPLLAARLAASPYAGLSADLTLNLYKQAFLLRFTAGELVHVEPLGFVDASMGADGGDLCIPPDAFVRLLLGYRTVEELADAWPDIMVRPARRHLWQVLWPKQTTYFWKPYMAFDANTRILADEFSQPA